MPRRPWQSPLVIAGLAVWLACLAGWGFMWTADRGLAIKMGTVFGAFLAGGVVAAVPAGLALKVPPVLIAFSILGPDAGAVLAAYPFTNKGFEALGRWSIVVHRLREKVHRDASRREGLVARFESVGLFLLCLTPIAYISPIVVAALGQLMGLTTRRVLVPVFLGMTTLVVLLIIAFSVVFKQAAQIDHRLPFVLTGLILLFLVTREFMARRSHRKKMASNAAAQTPAEDAQPSTPVEEPKGGQP